MATSRVFISFDYDHDVALRDFLVGQAKNDDTPFLIENWSLSEPFVGDWKAKIRDRISRTHQVIVICGKHTDTATGVSAEIQIARDLGKPYFLLAGYKDGGNVKPKATLTSDKMYRWTWENLKVLIHGGR